MKKDIVISLLAGLGACLAFAHSINPFLFRYDLDSNIFQQMGLAVLQGKVPYVDIFDHKGILLYYIQALGQLICPGRGGIFALFVLNVSCCVFLWIRTAKQAISGWQSYLPAGIALAIYAFLMPYGNLTEDWSLPFISYVFFLLSASYYKGENTSKWQYLLIGICAGVITFIRVNNNAPLLFAFICLLITEYRREGNTKTLFRNIINCGSGFCLVVAMVLISFGLSYGFNKIYDMLYGTFLFNFDYFAKFTAASKLSVPFCLSVIFSVATVLACPRIAKIECWFVPACFLFCYLTFGKAFFNHYFTVTVPVYLFSGIFIILSDLYKSIPYKKHIAVVIFIAMAVGVFYKLPSMRHHYEQRYKNTSDMKIIREVIEQEIDADETNSIWNYNAEGFGVAVLQEAGIVQCNRIILEHEKRISSSLVEPIALEDYCPSWIMTGSSGIASQDSSFFAENYEKRFTVEFLAYDMCTVDFYMRKVDGSK